MKSLGVAAVLVLLSLSAPSRSQSNSHIEIRTIGIPPYGIQDIEEPGGIYYETANLLAREAGYQASNYIYPYARIVNELKSGQTDLTIMFKYEELEGHVLYIAPLPALKTVVVGLKGSTFNSIEDLEGKTLAYLRGAKFSQDIDDNPQIHKRLTEDFAQSARMLLYGRVDAIIGPLDPIRAAIAKSSDVEKVLGKPLIVDERTPWVQLSKKSALLPSADKLKAVFEDIKASGTLAAIQRKYGAQHE